MRTFNLFIEDARYTVPTLAIVTVSDAQRAMELARKQLADSPHHLAVEVHEGDELVARLDRDGGSPP
jgi:hypothetical protein